MYVLATCSTEFDFINCKNTYHTYSTKLHILKIYSELQKVFFWQTADKQSNYLQKQKSNIAYVYNMIISVIKFFNTYCNKK